MKNSITIWDIESTRYLTDEYVILNFYISDLVNNQIEIIEIITKIHLVCNFKAKLLIDIDILNSEKMNINFFQWILIIDNEWKTNIYVHTKNNTWICIKVWVLKQIIISLQSVMTILIQTEFSLSTDWDFIFTSIYSEAYAHLVDANVQFVHLKNDLNQSIHINLKNCLEKIIEMKKKHCYLVDENSHNLAALKFVKLLSKCKHSEHSHSVTNSKEDVSISFSIKIHQNIKSDQLKEIMNK